MDKVNEQLALVLDADNDYSDGSLREKNAIEYMTIDGKTHIAVYIDKSTYADEDGELDYVQFEEIEHLEAVENLEDDDMEYTVEGRLFKLYTTSKGVYLEKLVDEDINEQLNVKKSVLDGYEEGDAYCVDATGSTVKVLTNYVPAESEDEDAEYDEAYKVDAGNKYFVGMYDDGDPVYTVMTLEELKNCIDEDAYAQILTNENDRQTRTTVVGGYFFLELESDTASDYLYIEKIGRVTADGRKVDVVFSNGDKKTVTIDEENSDDLVKNVLYTYVYNFMADDYELDLIEMPEQENGEIIDFDSDNIVWVDEGDEFELEDEVIAIVTIEIDRDRDYSDDDTPAFELVNKGIKFVALKDLKDSMIMNGEDNKTYTQYTDYRWDSEELFYVADFQIMDTAQEITDELPDCLAEIFKAILAGEKSFELGE